MPTIADILIEQGRNLANVRRRRGERAGAITTSMGQIPAAIIDDRDQAKERARQQARQAAADARAQTETELAVSAEGRARAAAARQAEQFDAAKVDEQRGREAVQGWMKQHAATIPPDELSRMQMILDMPGGVQHLVAGLSKAPEGYTLNLGDKRFVDGKEVASNPKPVEPPTEHNPTEASLALKAASGDPAAAKALALLRQQNASSAARDPLDSQTEWAIAPGETKARLMTKAEIRRLGAQRPAGADKPSSGLQKRVLNFFNRAKQADMDLEKLEPAVAQMGLAGQARQAWAPNVLQSEQGQLYDQAQRAFTEARLRKDSGAAIPEHEFTNDRRTYFVQPGDTLATIKQKNRARATLLASLAFESGQALPEDMGDPDAAQELIQSYKTRANPPQLGPPIPKNLGAALPAAAPAPPPAGAPPPAASGDYKVLRRVR